MTEQEAIKNINTYIYSELESIPKHLLESLKLSCFTLKEVEQYRAIGTPDECRAAVEKQKAKKPVIEYKKTNDCVTEVEWKCPTCGTNYIELAPCGEWCRYCGTKLDWSEEE